MKINIFIPTVSGGKFASSTAYHSSLSGSETTGPYSPGDEVIRAIDESKMSPEKIIAQRFLEFLGNRRLTVQQIKEFSIEEQNRLKKEFIEG